jgi:CBS domain-containing protein
MLINAILRSKGALVVTIAPDVTVTDAARALNTYGVGALVVSTDGAHIDGILSERDIARTIGSEGDAALGRVVADLMTAEVTTCHLDDTTDLLMEIMTARRIRHLPVVDGDDDHLVGIVSIGDVVKHRLDELQTETQVLHDYIATGR